MIEVLLATITLLAAVPPNVTVAPETKFVPLIVTAVPPLLDPELGETVYRWRRPSTTRLQGNHLHDPVL